MQLCDYENVIKIRNEWQCRCINGPDTGKHHRYRNMQFFSSSIEGSMYNKYWKKGKQGMANNLLGPPQYLALL